MSSTLPTKPLTDTPTIRERVVTRVPGLALAFAIAVVATVIGTWVPIIGGPVSGIVIGVVLAIVLTPGDVLKPGIATASRFVLQLSVVLLGAQLSLGQIANVGYTSLPVMLGTLTICLLGAYLIGRWLGIVGDLRTLIGVGTGICGASAIAAVTPVIGAVSVDVAYAISTVFVFNIAAVLVFPFIGHALDMSQHAFGLFAGTAVNDTSSVVAAASIYGTEATNYAVVVKLTRTLLIIPICLGLAMLTERRVSRTAAVAAPSGTHRVTEHDEEELGAPVSEVRPVRSPLRITRLVPWFLIGFVLVAAVNSIGLIPAGAHGALSRTSVFMITAALSAIGLSTNVGGLRRTGPRPLILGGCLWVLVSVSSLGLQALTGSI